MLVPPRLSVPWLLLVTVTVFTGAMPPCGTAPKLSLVGEALAPSPVPVPLSATVCRAAPAVDESLIFMVAVSLATTVALTDGVKETR